MPPDDLEHVGLVQCYEKCEDQENTPGARRLKTRFSGLLLAIPKSDESAGRLFLRIVVLGFALWGLIDATTHRLLPQVIRMFDTPPPHDCWCGETDAQAVEMGCKWDHLAVDWLPAHCTDQELVDEFDVSGPGIGGAWPYYDAVRDGERILAVYPISTQQTDEFAIQGKDYFTTREWHILHCMFTWRKQFRARQHHRSVEPWNEKEEHIKHCSDYIMETLKGNVSLDAIDTIIPGTNRHVNEK